MTVKEEEVKDLFFRISEKSISREAAAEQAVIVRESNDNGNLEFSPLRSERKIWDAYLFIELFAEKMDENTYLYCETDLTNYINQNGWKDI